MSLLRCVLLTIVVFAMGARATPGQVTGGRRGEAVRLSAAVLPAPTAVDDLAWLRPVSSALVPGTGQLLAGQDRGALYLVAEAFVVAQFLRLRAQGVRERDRYRDLAFTVARAPFRPARRDTVFEYFEHMERFIESGPFDTDPGPNLVPPTNEATYNGRIWALARATFFPDPDAAPPPDSEEYQRALAFYQERAVGPNFQWSWRNAGLERDLYGQSIRGSDDAFRVATQYLGLVLANHLLSAIDGFVSYRLGTRAAAAAIRPDVSWSRPSAVGDSDFNLGVRITF